MVVAIKGWIGTIDTNTISLSYFSMLRIKSSIWIIGGAGISFGVRISLGVARNFIKLTISVVVIIQN